MSDRDALLAAIRAAPDDDAPRLVYADWLDEHGDPDRAEFIRLQIEIDPYRRPDSDLDRWRRATIDLHLHLDRPVPADFPEPMHRYAALARREAEILKARRSEWYGPLNPVDNDYTSHLAVTFRRGFPDEVALTASAFLDAAAAVREACPTLRRLTLYAPRDHGPDLAATAALAGIPELDLAGWLTPFDARFLATFLAVHPVRSLRIWVGSEHDGEVIRTLATRPWEEDADGPSLHGTVLTTGPYLEQLRELVLVQLHGGMLAGDTDGNLDRRADALAAHFNLTLGRAVARVERPFARKFPLAGRIGEGLYAGRLPEGPVLVRGDRRPDLLHFDADGRLRDQETLDLTAQLDRAAVAVPGELPRGGAAGRPPPVSWVRTRADLRSGVLGRGRGRAGVPVGHVRRGGRGPAVGRRRR